MLHLKETPAFFKRVLNFIIYYLPSKKDNLFQSALKIIFIFSLVSAIIVTSLFVGYFSHGKRQQKIMGENETVWNNAVSKNDDGVYDTFKKQNPDFKAWLKVGTGVISYPVYQTDNNSFYKNHNFKKQNSRYGALFFDKDCNLKENDFNLLIYGNNMTDGSMFAKLEEYRKLEFFKQHNTILLARPKEKIAYKVVSAFIYKEEKAFNIFTQYIETEQEFSIWSEKIKNLSFINTDTDLKFGDTFLTLITDSNDIKGAKNVVIARKIRAFETSYTDTSNFTVNRNRELPNK